MIKVRKLSQSLRLAITGSNIKRTQQEGPASAQILTRKNIPRSDKTSMTDVVRGLLADNNGSISSSSSNEFADCTSGMSLCGCSVSSTLPMNDKILCFERLASRPVNRQRSITYL